MPYIFEVTRIGAGKLHIMPMPQPSREKLPETIAFYSQSGISKIVCLMEEHEMLECGLAQEAMLCQQMGISFTHFPVVDGQLPTDLQAFHRLVDAVHSDLETGASVAIHCWAGIGRTGVLAGCILTQAGYTPETAIQLLTNARGSPVPETMAQYDFIWEFGNSSQAPLLI